MGMVVSGVAQAGAGRATEGWQLPPILWVATQVVANHGNTFLDRVKTASHLHWCSWSLELVEEVRDGSADCKMAMRRCELYACTNTSVVCCNMGQSSTGK